MSEDKILIVKMKDKDRLDVKVRQKMRSGFAPNDYMKIVNIRDVNDVSILFEDLNLLFNVPIESAFRKYSEKKRGNAFPF